MKALRNSLIIGSMCLSIVTQSARAAEGDLTLAPPASWEADDVAAMRALGDLEVSGFTALTDNSEYDRNPSIVRLGSDYWLFYAKGDNTGTAGVRDPGYNPDADTYVVYYKTAGSIEGLAAAAETKLALSDDVGNGGSRPANFDQRVVTAATIGSDLYAIVSSGQSGTDRGLYYYKYSGASWSGPVTLLADATARGGHVNAVSDGSTIYIVWESSDGTADSYTFDGATLSAKVDISNDNMPKITLMGSILYAVSIEDGTGDIETYASLTSPVSWSPSSTAIIGAGLYDPCVFNDGTSLYVVTAPYVPADRQYLVQARSLPGTWSAAKTVSYGGYGTTEWWDYWPIGYHDGTDAWVFFTTEGNGSAFGDGEIAVVKMDWNLDNDHYFYIQNAIDQAVTGDTINVAAGTYREYLHITKDALTVSGAGIDQSIIDLDGLLPYWHYDTSTSYASRGGVLISAYGNSAPGNNMVEGDTELIEDVTFAGFTVKNAGVNPPIPYTEFYDNEAGRDIIRGIKIGSGKDILITECKVENGGDYGISSGQARKTDAGTRPPSEDITITYCVVRDNHDNGIAIGGTTGSITITDNTILDNVHPSLPIGESQHEKGIQVSGRSNDLALGGLIARNTVSGNAYHGINLYRYTNGITVEENVVTGHNLHSEGCGIFMGSSNPDRDCKNHVIRDNVLTDNIRGIIAYYVTSDTKIEENTITTDSGTFDPGQATIKIDNAHDIEVLNNTLYCDGFGIELLQSGSYGCTVSGNTVDGAMYAGVYIRNGAHDNTFTSNLITGTTLHTLSQYADWGMHDGGDGVAVLADSTQSWVDDALIGFTVLNLTDGSSGAIMDNDATTVTATLSGGTDNLWYFGDEYDIVYDDLQGDGVVLRGGAIYSGGEAGAGNVFHGNAIFGNAGDGVDNQVATMTADASGNWWGDGSGPGGAGSGTGDAVSANVDYSPWPVLDGTYPATGFEAEYSELWVDDDSPQSGTEGYITEALGIVTDSTINVAPGTYEEQVVIAMDDLDLLGSGSGDDPAGDSIIRSPVTMSPAFNTGSYDAYPVVGVVDATGVSIQDVRIDGFGRGNTNSRFMGAAFWNAGGDLTDCVVTGVRDTPFSGAQHGVAIYAYNDTGGPYTVDVTNTDVVDYQKNAMALSGTGLTANVTGCTTTGAGATDVTAQNGIQVSVGAGGTIDDCTVTGNIYTGDGWAATGVLLWQATAIAVTDTVITDNTPGVYCQDTPNATFDKLAVSNQDAESWDGLYAYNSTGARGDGPEPRLVAAPFIDDSADPAASTRAAMTVAVTNSTFDGHDKADTWGVSAFGTGIDPVNLTVTGTTVSDWDYGIVAYDYGYGTPVTLTANSNEIYDNASYGYYNYLTTGPQDATANWWGSCRGPYHTTGNPYGDGNNVSDNVDFEPWCNGDFSKCDFDTATMATTVWVDDDYTPNGSNDGHIWCYDAFDNIQDGVNAVAVGGTVNVAGDTFVEQVHITKNGIKLTGSGVDSTVIQSPAALSAFFVTGTNNNYPVLFVDGATDVSVSNLTVDGDHQGDDNYRFTGISFWNADGSVIDAKVVNIMNSVFSGVQHGVGIYAYNETGGPYSIRLKTVHVEDFQKNAVALIGAGLTVDVDDVTTIGAGATNVTAQNGIQISGGASGTVDDCSITGVAYIGTDWTATGLLIFGPGTVDATGVQIDQCETSVYYIDASGTFDAGTITAPLGDAYWAYSTGARGVTGTDIPRVLPDAFDQELDTGLRAALDVTVSNSVVTGTGAVDSWGVNAYAVGPITFIVSQCDVSGWDYGVVPYDGGGGITSTIHGNSITDCTLAIGTNAASVQNASGNWYGVTGPSDVAALIEPNIDYTPWLGDGTDTSGDPGFQGDFSTLWVDDDSPQTGLAACIEEALGLVTASTVYVAPGTYVPTVVLDDTVVDGLTLVGSNPADRPELIGGILFDNDTDPLDGVTLRHLSLKGDADPTGDEGIISMRNDAAVNDLSIEGCLLDAEGVAVGDDGADGRFGLQGNKLGSSLTITGCEFRNIPGWSVADIDTSYAGPPYGGNELALESIVFANNTIHECNGTVSLRGNSAVQTDTVEIYGNTWTNIGGNFGQAGMQWAALEINHASTAEVYDNRIKNVQLGVWGEGQAIQLWDVGTLDMHHNTFTENAQGIFVYGGSDGGAYGGPYAIPGGSVTRNTIAVNTEYGLMIDATATGGPLDAENNWWGDPSGPYDPTGTTEVPPCTADPADELNADGTGNEVGDGVDYCPWMTAPAMLTLVPDGDCYGTDDLLSVSIDLSMSKAVLVGGDFYLAYDNSALDFIGVAPGDGEPFTDVTVSADEQGGTIDIGVSVPEGDPPSAGDCTLAVVTFQVTTEVCDAEGLVEFRNDPQSVLHTNDGGTLAPLLSDLGVITIDGIPPEITCPSDVVISCGESIDPFDTGTAMASDNCVSTPDVTYTDDVVPEGCAETIVITRTWKATDECAESICDQIITVLAVQPPDWDGVVMSRYLYFTPENPGRQTALRVTLTDLPAPFGALDSQQMWVGPAFTRCENAGVLLPFPECPPVALLPDEFQTAGLQCTPHCMDFGSFDALHVTDDEIVPGAVYDIQVIDCGSDFGVEANYSNPLTIYTSIWGDLVGDCTVIPCTPPDGIVNVTTDVTAVLDKFKNLPGAVMKSRADIEPAVPDRLVNITDVTYCIDAFLGFSYPPSGWAGPDGCP